MNTMKKNRILTSILLVSLLGLLFSSCSDKMYVRKAITWAESGENLDTALKSVEKATELEETKNWPKTYYGKGFVYQKIYESKKTDIAEDPLFKAFDNYKEAYNMEGADNIQGSIDAALFKMRKYFINDGVKAFKNKDYDKALHNFEYALKASAMPVFKGQIDTAVMYNAAIAAQNIKEWDKAAKYYKKVTEYDYQGPRAYALLKNAYMQAGDTSKAVEAMKEGFNKYPSNQMMVQNLINYYLLNAEEPKNALKYLNRAIEEHPDQSQYYSAKGQIYDETGDLEKAKKFYKEALEIDDKNYTAAYNLGVIYFNKGVDIVTKANKIKDEEKYKKMKDEADNYFLKAIPYMEKAHKIKPEDKQVMSTLKTLYYRLRMEDKDYLRKYKELQKKMDMQSEED
jgi:tetratricopeptide (TPR) repeat protein